MERIAIVGTTGSGKSTLADMLAARCALEHVELDALFWGANWTPPSSFELFRLQVEQALQGDRWVTSGNYSSAREVVWTRADTLVWLDYPLSLVLRRLFRRNVQRLVRRVELWNGNRESWRTQFLSRDSLFVWACKTHNKLQREYPEILALDEYRHLEVLHFREPRTTEEWLKQLKHEK